MRDAVASGKCSDDDDDLQIITDDDYGKESLMTVAAGGPIFCFDVLLKSLMTVVKSVSDGLRHWSERLRV